jgi:hypothetical protein
MAQKTLEPIYNSDSQQTKRIRNKIDDAERDIKNHINAAERCILEALENISIDGGEIDLSNYYTNEDIDYRFTALKEEELLKGVKVSMSGAGNYVYGTTQNVTIKLNVNNNSLKPSSFDLSISGNGKSSTGEGISLSLHDTVSKTTQYSGNAQYYGVENKSWSASCQVNFYHKIKYGFGETVEDMLENDSHEDFKTSLNNQTIYCENTYKPGCNFFLLVPSTNSGTTPVSCPNNSDNFVMGAINIVMTHSNGTYNGVNYKVFKTESTYGEYSGGTTGYVNILIK